jgi:hypothetical protein
VEVAMRACTLAALGTAPGSLLLFLAPGSLLLFLRVVVVPALRLQAARAAHMLSLGHNENTAY